MNIATIAQLQTRTGSITLGTDREGKVTIITVAADHPNARCRSARIDLEPSLAESIAHQLVLAAESARLERVAILDNEED